MNNTLLAACLISTCLVTACTKPAQNDSPNSNVSTHQAEINNNHAADNIASGSSTLNNPSTSLNEPIGKDWPIKQYFLYGTKENWRVLVDLNQVTVEGSELPNGRLQVERLAYAKGVEFNGILDNKELGLNIRTQSCTDANNRNTKFTATVYYNDKIYKGCAVEGRSNKSNS